MHNKHITTPNRWCSPPLPPGQLVSVWPPRKAGMWRGRVSPQWHQTHAHTGAQRRCATRPLTHKDTKHLQHEGDVSSLLYATPPPPTRGPKAPRGGVLRGGGG